MPLDKIRVDNVLVSFREVHHAVLTGSGDRDESDEGSSKNEMCISDVW